MPLTLRRLGVYGANNPTKKSAALTASNFLIAGLIGRFERKFDKAFSVNSPQQALAIFGNQIDPAMYGWDAVNGFFANAQGVGATLWIASHVGYTGTAIDATVASQGVADTQVVPAAVLTLAAAYQGNAEYGISGNRTGYTVELGDRFATTATGFQDDGITAVSATSTSFQLASVSGIVVGDLIKFVCTGAGVGTVWKKITAINSAKKAVYIGSAIGAIYPAAGNASTIPGFRIHTWRQSLTGALTEVDTAIGQTWLTTEPEVTNNYAPNVFGASSWLSCVVNATTPPTLDKKFPAAVSAVSLPPSPAYVTGAVVAANGTSATTAAHWSRTLTRFDGLPVRMMANVETTDSATQLAVETYTQGRADNPKVIWCVPEAQTKAQLLVIGNNFQRGDAVLGAIPAHWLLVSDPFNQNVNAPYRHVPNGGHVMGLWCRSIGTKGIHWIPATQDMPIYGVTGISGDQFLNDQDRTDLAMAGINCIQQLPGAGVVLRNMFSCSTDPAFMFMNGLMMRDYIKVSAVDSLAASENEPNSIGRIKEDKMAILNFLYKMWDAGSTGNVPKGETFGQTFQADGVTPTTVDMHVEVQADLVNNPLTAIQAGQRNLDVWFTYPSPAGSIKIGVGIKLLA